MRLHPHRADRLETELRQARDHARGVLVSLPAGSRQVAATLYAAAAADRLFRWYDAAPESERRAYSETWRPVLHDVWAHLAGDDDAYARISHALGRFHLSVYSNDGRDGPDDIDQDEAAATLYTANCVMHGLVDFALWSTARATDHLDTVWHGNDETRRVREIGAELQRQAADLQDIVQAARADTITAAGVPPELLVRLRR